MPANSGLTTLADPGYEGAGTGIRARVRRSSARWTRSEPVLRVSGRTSCERYWESLSFSSEPTAVPTS